MTAIAGSGLWISRRHAVVGSGIAIVRVRGVSHHDTVVPSVDESKTKRLVIAAPESTFGASLAPTNIHEKTESPADVPLAPTSTLATALIASIPPSVGPLTVNFSTAPTGGVGPYTYVWDFGDGTTSTSQNPVHTYLQPGSLSVLLTVTDSTGFVITERITVYVAITLSASIAAVPVAGSVPLVVAFNAVPANGTAPYTYAWDFGDGGTSTLQAPTHSFSSAGLLLPTVVITDATGHHITASIALEVAPRLFADPVRIPDIGPVHLPVRFWGRVRGGTPPYTYVWDFADGFGATELDTFHVFDVEGYYNVSLFVTDSLGRVFLTFVAVNVGPVVPLQPVDQLVLDLETQPYIPLPGFTSSDIP